MMGRLEEHGSWLVEQCMMAEPPASRMGPPILPACELLHSPNKCHTHAHFTDEETKSHRSISPASSQPAVKTGRHPSICRA